MYLYFSHIDLAWSSLFVIFVKLVLFIETIFGAVKQLTSVIVLFSDLVCLIILQNAATNPVFPLFFRICKFLVSQIGLLSSTHSFCKTFFTHWNKVIFLIQLYDWHHKLLTLVTTRALLSKYLLRLQISKMKSQEY